jgi:hypothetical protein
MLVLPQAHSQHTRWLYTTTCTYTSHTQAELCCMRQQVRRLGHCRAPPPACTSNQPPEPCCGTPTTQSLHAVPKRGLAVSNILQCVHSKLLQLGGPPESRAVAVSTSPATITTIQHNPQTMPKPPAHQTRLVNRVHARPQQVCKHNLQLMTNPAGVLKTELSYEKATSHPLARQIRRICHPYKVQSSTTHTHAVGIR